MGHGHANALVGVTRWGETPRSAGLRIAVAVASWRQSEPRAVSLDSGGEALRPARVSSCA